MADVKWIKLAADIFDNRKIRQIEHMPEGDALIVVWLKLLVLAGNVNDGGLVYFTREIPYTDQLLATEFNRPLPVIQLAMATFRKFGMVDIIEDVIHISNWEKYQNTEGMDRIREQNRLRVSRFREQKKLLAGCNVTGNVTVTESNATDIEEELETEEEKREKKKKKPDTAEAVVDLIREYTQNEQLQDALVAFVQFRQDIKKPMSAGAVKLLTGKLDKLAETDDDRIEILNNSIVNGWTGIYAMKGDKDGKIPERRRPAPGKYEPLGSGETIV